MLPEEPAMEKARIPQPSDSSPDRRKDRSSSRNISQAKSKFTSASTSALVKESPEADLSKSKIKNQPEVSNSPSNMYTSLSSRKDYKFSSSNGNLLGNSQTENAKKVLKTEVSVVKTDRRFVSSNKQKQNQGLINPQASRIDLQSILSSIKSTKSPKHLEYQSTVFLSKSGKPESKGEGDLGRLRALIQSINQTLSRTKTDSKQSNKPLVQEELSRKNSKQGPLNHSSSSKNRVLEQVNNIRNHGKSTSSLVNGKEKEHNEAGVSAKINPLNISMTASKQTEAARGLLKSRGSDSERYIGASISSSTHLLRKLSNTSLRRLGLKENGFASTSRMKDEDCSPDSKAQLSTSRMNSSSTSRGKVDLYAGRTTGGSKAALLLAEALRAPYFDRLSAEGRKALAGSRALAHKEVRRTATGASVDSAHNLYTRQATSLAAPSK